MVLSIMHSFSRWHTVLQLFKPVQHRVDLRAPLRLLITRNIKSLGESTDWVMVSPQSYRNLEDELQRELQAARGISGIIRPTEKWRGRDAHEILIVDMIQNIESVGGQFELLRVVIATFQAEGFSEAQVNIGIAWPMACIPSDARRTVIEHGIPVVVQTGRNIEGDSGSYSHHRSNSKAPRQIVHAHEMELVAAVIVRSAPLGAQVVIICGQEKQSAGIVHRARKNVLGVETDIPTGMPAQRKGHAVAAR